MPYFLSPYRRFTTNSYMYIWKNKLIKNRSKAAIADDVVCCIDTDIELNYEERYVDRSLCLLRQTVHKLTDFLDRNGRDTGFLKGKERFKQALLYLDAFADDSGTYRGAAGFSFYSYEKQGGYRTNPQFMFGTAYQFL